MGRRTGLLVSIDSMPPLPTFPLPFLAFQPPLPPHRSPPCYLTHSLPPPFSTPVAPAVPHYSLLPQPVQLFSLHAPAHTVPCTTSLLPASVAGLLSPFSPPLLFCLTLRVGTEERGQAKRTCLLPFRLYSQKRRTDFLARNMPSTLTLAFLFFLGIFFLRMGTGTTVNGLLFHFAAPFYHFKRQTETTH